MGRLGGSTTPWECEWEHKFSQSSEWVDLVVVRYHGSVSGNTSSLRAVSDDLVVVRHHGSVSGSTSSLRAVSDDLVVVRHHGSVHRDDMDGRVCEREDSMRVDLVVVRHHGSGNRHSLRTQVM